MSKKRPRLWYIYIPLGLLYHKAWALLIIYGLAVQSLNEIISKSSHAFFFYIMAFFWELVGYKSSKFMNTKFEEMVYETPQVEIIEVEVENGFAMSGGNVENPTESNESPW